MRVILALAVAVGLCALLALVVSAVTFGWRETAVSVRAIWRRIGGQ